VRPRRSEKKMRSNAPAIVSGGKALQGKTNAEPRKTLGTLGVQLQVEKKVECRDET